MKRQLLVSVFAIVASIQVHAARDIAERAARGIGNKVQDIPAVSKKLEQIERLAPKLPEQAIEQINKNIEVLDKAALGSMDPLAKIAGKVRIADKLGNTVLVETEVEDGWRAIEREWLIIGSEADIALLKQLNMEIIELQKLKGLNMTLVRFKTPLSQDDKTLKDVLPQHLSQQLGRNHIYDASQVVAKKDKPSTATSIKQSACHKKVTVGMIDTSVEEQHQAFNSVTITQKNFMPEDIPVPKAHGTAVAGLLVGGGKLTPLLPKADLYAASVFYPRNDYTQGATLMHLLQALNWLVEQDVEVINMSLTGPDNPILAMGIKQAAKSNVVLVAAAGNEGPAAAPRFPAAYDEVIAATAVDRQRKIYRWANQGSYIDFSALGVAVQTARLNNSYGRESGTSMASPVVMAKAACAVTEESKMETVVESLRQQAIDLGEPGKDGVYGYGFVE